MRARTQDNRSGSWDVRGRRPLLTHGLRDQGLIGLPAPGTVFLRRSLLGSGLPDGRAYAFAASDHTHPVDLPHDSTVGCEIHKEKEAKRNRCDYDWGLRPLSGPPGDNIQGLNVKGYDNRARVTDVRQRDLTTAFET